MIGGRKAFIDHSTLDVVCTAATASRALGMTLGTLRVWRHRHPGILEPIRAHDTAGMAIYRLDDVERARLLRTAVTSTFPIVAE